jgi:hypothetical protein
MLLDRTSTLFSHCHILVITVDIARRVLALISFVKIVRRLGLAEGADAAACCCRSDLAAAVRKLVLVSDTLGISVVGCGCGLRHHALVKGLGLDVVEVDQYLRGTVN